MSKYYIEDYELCDSYFGENGLSYRLDTYGDSLEELLNNSEIIVLDRYGIQLYTDNIHEYSDEIIEYVKRVIGRNING